VRPARTADTATAAGADLPAALRQGLAWLAVCASLAAHTWGWAAGPAEFLGDPPQIGFQVVVHGDHAGDEITPLQLRRIFLRQITRWPDGRGVVPINGPPDSELRQAITGWLFPEGRAGLVYHWNKLYYQGVLPPRALASYSAVALMVARVPGAVGYLPAGQPHPNLRVLQVTGMPTSDGPRTSPGAPQGLGDVGEVTPPGGPPTDPAPTPDPS